MRCSICGQISDCRCLENLRASGLPRQAGVYKPRAVVRLDMLCGMPIIGTVGADLKIKLKPGLCWAGAKE